ncbi:MAG TPA: DUF72 domain-containing protein [Thermoplasmata archaeon]|jgi:uncharacterized protein YecE (DUF72 family)
MNGRVIWVGTCGFAGKQSDAYRRFHAVEIQETFYHPVDPKRAAKWRAAAPEEFHFVVKASQFITHEASSPTYRRARRTIPDPEKPAYGSFQDTTVVREGWDATRASAEAVQAKAVLFQCPPAFVPTPVHLRNLYRFFESISFHGIRAWEPRGPWPSHVVEKVCEDLDLVHAVDPFAAEPATSGLAYFRLHGRPPGARLYHYTYNDADLARLRAVCEEYDDAYAMFNNLSMADDAVRFRRLIEGRDAALGARD